jgi:OOP family OmpA-OmpF porin
MTGVARQVRAAGFAIAISLLMALPAPAQRSYFGASYSSPSVEGFSTSNKGYKLFIGYDFPRFFGLEAGYVDFGKVGYELEGMTRSYGTLSLAGKGWDVALTARDEIGKVLALTAKAGNMFWNSDVSSTISFIPGGSDSGRSFFYGFGVRINLVTSLSLLVDAERYSVGENTLDLFNVGVRFNF